MPQPQCAERQTTNIYRSVDALTKESKNDCRERDKEKRGYFYLQVRSEVGERLAKPRGVR